MVENSCKTPSILTVATAAPVKDESSTRRKEFPIVVPNPPGGGSDFAARLYQDALARALGTTVVIDNRPGANGNIAIQHVVRSAPESLSIHGEDTPGLAHRALAVAAGPPPVAAAAPLRVDYRRFGQRLPVVAADDLLAGRFDPRELAGRVVYVGASALELQDLWPTPIDPALPGVFIQALVHRTLAARGAGEPTLALASPRAQDSVRLLHQSCGRPVPALPAASLPEARRQCRR